MYNPESYRRHFPENLEVDGVVPVLEYPQVDGVAAHVTRGHKQVRPDLPLDAERPRLHIRRLHVLMQDRKELRKWRKPGAGRVVRNRRAARVACPRILETARRTSDRRLESPR